MSLMHIIGWKNFGMKIITVVGWGSAWLGVASWLAFFAGGTVAMSEGGLAFIGTVAMLIVYAVPVGFHFLAICLGLKTKVSWLLPIASVLWILPAAFALPMALASDKTFHGNPPPAHIRLIFIGIGCGFIVQAIVGIVVFIAVRLLNKKQDVQVK